jgi:hypothetical protein
MAVGFPSHSRAITFIRGSAVQTAVIRLGARALAALAVLLVLARPAPAQWRLFESDFDEEKKPWAEIEAQLPAYPKQENLIAFDAGAATQHRFYIDTSALSVGEDGVVRYTMVVKSGGGATNVSFEGMRCATQEQKLYAVGHRDGGWARARDPRWRRIEYRELNRHHAVLYSEFLCPERHVRMVTAKQMLEALQRASAGLR